MHTPAVPSEVSLREVRVDDLPIFFQHQLDPEATRMAAFPSRDHDAFMAHWGGIMANPTANNRTILVGGCIAGNVGAWTDGADRLVGYWIGREFWGRGVATAALSQFLHYELTRPLTARVVKHNVGSIRVLQKAGFTLVGEESYESAGATEVELIFRFSEGI